MMEMFGSDHDRKAKFPFQHNSCFLEKTEKNCVLLVI